ncbi:Mitochondrial dicarboxylate transporter, partial [Coemansia spiralis]
MASAGVQVALPPSAALSSELQWPLVKKPHAPFYFGGFAACAANFFTHPLDLLKVRLQTVKGSPGGTGLAHVIRGIHTQQGLLGFYDGISAAVLRQMTYSMARFSAYET